jgi:hypothetical protein
VEYVRDSLGRERVSERRVCRVLGQSRSTQRLVPHIYDDELRQVKANDRTRHAIWTIWISSDHGHALPGRLERQSQAN